MAGAVGCEGCWNLNRLALSTFIAFGAWFYLPQGVGGSCNALQSKWRAPEVAEHVKVGDFAYDVDRFLPSMQFFTVLKAQEGFTDKLEIGIQSRPNVVAGKHPSIIRTKVRKFILMRGKNTEPALNVSGGSGTRVHEAGASNYFHTASNNFPFSAGQTNVRTKLFFCGFPSDRNGLFGGLSSCSSFFHRVNAHVEGSLDKKRPITVARSCNRDKTHDQKPTIAVVSWAARSRFCRCSSSAGSGLPINRSTELGRPARSMSAWCGSCRF